MYCTPLQSKKIVAMDRLKVAAIKIKDRSLYHQLITSELGCIKYYHPQRHIDWERIHEVLVYNMNATNNICLASKMKDIDGGWMLLHYASYHNAPELTMNLLIQLNLNAVKSKDDNGLYPLHVACMNSNNDSCRIRKLIELFPPAVEQMGYHDYRYPLGLACKHQQPETIIIHLIELYPKAIRQQDRYGCYVLHSACKFLQSETVIEKLMESFPEALRSVDRRGRNPLHRACMYQKVESIIYKILDMAPYSVQQKDNYNQYPLHTACTHKQSENVILKIIDLFPKAAVQKDWYGKYPLGIAYRNIHSEAVISKLIYEMERESCCSCLE